METKKIISAFFALLLIFLVSYPKNTRAQQISNISIEDAVYADLAVRHYLTNISVKTIESNPQDNININTDKQWLPASTVKTYVAMYAFKKIQDKQLNLEDPIFIDPQNVVTTEMETEELPALNEGQTVTVERLIKQMITQSDNTAYNVLLDVLDRRDITNYAHSLGLVHTSIGSKLNLDSNQEQEEINVPGYGINTTTADDYSKAFDMIRWGKVPQARQLYLILTQQKINNMIPLLLPKNIVVAHKTGDLDPLYHDGGIIDGPSRIYALSLFSNLGDPMILAHVSQLIYTKNYSLVGADIPAKVVSEDINPPVDPLVLNPNPNSQLLGTKDITNIRLPSINAADLGIKPEDLSLNLTKQELPPVVIPNDSPVHFLVTGMQFLKGFFVPKIQNNLDTLNLKLAEASDLENRNKNEQAKSLMNNINSQLITTVSDKKITENNNAQTAAETVSETRFSVLGQLLKSENSSERSQTIKTIAQQARDTLEKVQPNIPNAITETSLSQRPLIGNITKTEDSKITVKTSSGQEISVPINNDIRIRQKDNTTQTTIAPSQLSVGSTIALIGSSEGNNFKASFILSNLPKQLVAPQPALVLKVNKKDKTMVVSENGVPIQVNITDKTVIKGSGTNLSLDSIKANNVVLVRGENITQTKTASSSANLSPKETILPSGIAQSSETPKASISPKNSMSLSPSPSKSPKIIQPSPSNPSPKKDSQGANPAPMVIKSTTIQIIEQNKTKSSKVENKPQNSSPNKENKSQKPSTKTTKPISYYLLEILPEKLRLLANL